jgi:hypothetical protein
MKVNNLPPSIEEYPSMSSQSEAAPSNRNIHRRPVPIQASGTTSPQEDHSWEENPGFDSTPPSFGESEGTYSDYDTNVGVATPIMQSQDGNLPLEEARCSLLPNRSAAWSVQGKDLRLSTLAAAVLMHENILNFKDLDL